MAITCPKCSGSGKMEVKLFFSVTIDPCDMCKGTGKIKDRCSVCKVNEAVDEPTLFGYLQRPCDSCKKKQQQEEEEAKKQHSSSSSTLDDDDLVTSYSRYFKV